MQQPLGAGLGLVGGLLGGGAGGWRRRRISREVFDWPAGRMSGVLAGFLRGWFSWLLREAVLAEYYIDWVLAGVR